eukprot:4080041-Heterocapsa_arctica.AAC.1
MVEDLQRQVSSFEELYATQPPKGHPIPAPPRGEEAASGFGGDMSAMIARAVAAAFSSHVPKSAAPIFK